MVAAGALAECLSSSDSGILFPGYIGMHVTPFITAHSVLYGAIREAVSWITGRHPYGQISLGLSILSSPPEERTKVSSGEESEKTAE